MAPVRILIAEDEKLQRELLKSLLEAEGWEVLAAADGEQALALARAERPDVVLLDIVMPHRDGFEVLRELRSDPDEAVRGAPVILLTALSRLDDRVRGLESGADDYIPKPCHALEVAARVRAQLRIRQVQAQAMEAERIRVALETAGAAAHEMSQPLTVLMGNLELLLSRMPPDDPLRSLALAIQRSGERVTGLLRRLQGVRTYATKQYVDSTILDIEQASPAGDDPAPATGTENGPRGGE